MCIRDRLGVILVELLLFVESVIVFVWRLLVRLVKLMRIKDNTKAVSYTHLDVYKRQVSGSGDAIVAPEAPIREQFYHEIDFMHRKWPEVHKYLVYFQNFTNTHAPLEVIKDRYEQAINEPGVVGINIGTRPDCLPDDVIDYLAELTDRMHVTVELGLQTTYEETSELINRAHSYELYVETVKRLRCLLYTSRCV